MANLDKNTPVGTPLVWGDFLVCDYEQTNPLAGQPCTFIEWYGMGKAGYDCLVAVPIGVAAAAYAASAYAANDPRMATEEAWRAWFAEQDWVRGDMVHLEANSEDELLDAVQMEDIVRFARRVAAGARHANMAPGGAANCVVAIAAGCGHVAAHAGQPAAVRNYAGAVGRQLAAMAAGAAI